MPQREVLVDVFQTTLAGAMLAGDTTAQLASVTGLPAATPFRLRIDDDPVNFAGTYEITRVLSVNGGTSVVSFDTPRAVDGTSAIGHSVGAKVTAVMTKQGLDAMYDPSIKFRGYASGSQSVPSASNTTIPIDTVVYDEGSNFNTGTHTWTCPTDGKYLVIARVEYGAACNNVIQIVRNGNINADNRGTYGSLVASVTMDVLSLATGDQLVLSAFQNSGSTQTTVAGQGFTFFSVSWMGS